MLMPTFPTSDNIPQILLLFKRLREMLSKMRPLSLCTPAWIENFPEDFNKIFIYDSFINKF